MLNPALRQERPENKKIGIKGFITPFLVLVMLGVAFEGALREGILTWMPTYISQTYDLGSEISILSGVILPVFSTASVVLSMVIYEHFIKNPLRYATLVLVIGAVFSGVLYAFTGEKRRYLGRLVCNYHRRDARSEPDADDDDTAALFKKGQCVDCLRRYQRSHICGKRTVRSRDGRTLLRLRVESP